MTESKFRIILVKQPGGPKYVIQKEIISFDQLDNNYKNFWLNISFLDQDVFIETEKEAFDILFKIIIKKEKYYDKNYTFEKENILDIVAELNIF